jgi:hypothetical protein
MSVVDNEKVRDVRISVPKSSERRGKQLLVRTGLFLSDRRSKCLEEKALKMLHNILNYTKITLLVHGLKHEDLLNRI